MSLGANPYFRLERAAMRFVPRAQLPMLRARDRISQIAEELSPGYIYLWSKPIQAVC
jgi:hypothetical protein